jgi:creatinine amidohydrolase
MHKVRTCCFFLFVFYIVFSIMFIYNATGYCQDKDTVPYRKLADYNWKQFKEVVPEKVNTVLLVTGTMEAHGVGNNGADYTVPQRLAEMICREVNALVAPPICYGRTVTLAPYPGGITISEPTFKNYVKEVIEGLVKNGFKNIIIINGHGPNRKPVDEALIEVALKDNVRGMVIDWWSYTSDITQEVFKQDGGHAGINENAAMLAAHPNLVHKELYNKDETIAIDPSYTAVPSPAAILLYKAGEGYPNFNEAQAEEYFKKVANKLAALIKETISKWNKAGL